MTNITKALDACHCQTCRPITMDDMRMVLCPTCGNKRCPHANDHRNACTNSNEPGQPGSAYPASALRAALQDKAGVPADVARDAGWFRLIRDGGGWPAVFASHDAPEPLRGDDLDAAMIAASQQKGGQ